MTIINGRCTPSVTVEVDYDENPNGLPVVWLKTGHKTGVHAPLNKEAVKELIADLKEKLKRM